MGRSATSWAPGQSGNPAGRRVEVDPNVQAVIRLAQEKTPRAFAVVLELMESAEKDSVRLAAALSVLKAAGVKFDGEQAITVNLPPPQTSAQAIPTGRLLALKSVTSTMPRSRPSSGDGES